MRVIICGGGVIGAATAWFLARRGATPVIVEPTGVACAASGKSGGFLARDWCDGGPLEDLARRSFDLHARLAGGDLPGDWGYRRMMTYSGTGRPGGSATAPSGWVGANVRLGQRLGTTETTAQVHPAAFTKALVADAESHGARLVPGRVTGLIQLDGGTVGGVVTEDGPVEGDAVVIAMGPWSLLAAAWLPLPGVYGLKGSSIVFRTGTDIPAEALFLDFREASGAQTGPEVFPRPDGTTYICGMPSEGALPLAAADVAPDADGMERLEAICRAISPALAKAEVVARQACFRPVTEDGRPLIGRIPGFDNAYVATGHSVWGILNAPATGEAMADLILDGEAREVDLAPFDPGRLRPFDAAKIRVSRAGQG